MSDQIIGERTSQHIKEYTTITPKFYINLIIQLRGRTRQTDRQTDRWPERPDVLMDVVQRAIGPPVVRSRNRVAGLL